MPRPVAPGDWTDFDGNPTSPEEAGAANDRRYEAEMRRRDREQSAPYREAYRQGRTDASTSGGGGSSRPLRSGGSGGRLALPRGISGGVDEGAGLIAGLVAYALFLAYLRGGTPAVKSWLSAKFINKPTAAAAPSTIAPGSTKNPNGTVTPTVPPPSNLRIDPATGQLLAVTQ